MLPDPANPQPDEPPRDLAQKSGTVVPGLVSIGITVAVAILVHQLAKRDEDSLDTIAPKRPEPEAKLLVEPASKENLATDSSEATGLKPTQPLQLPTGVLPIDIRRDYLRDFGALGMGVASLLLTGVIALFAYGINENQVATMKDEVKLKLVEELKKHLTDLTLSEIPEEPGDSNINENKTKNKEIRRKKFLASIALAQYGESALPALKMSLAGEDALLREGAAVVLRRMLEEKELRPQVFRELLKYFDEPSMRLVLLEFFVGLHHGLSHQERNEASTKFKQYVIPTADYQGMLHEQDVLLETAKFFGNWPSRDSTMFLLAVAKNTTCGSDPREQALNYLPPAVKKAKDVLGNEQDALRKEVIAELEKLLPEASDRLKTNITDAIAELQKQ